ncbi:MAG: hypothetical protein PVI86_19335, partial [Phycisphaerae bacterium]
MRRTADLRVMVVLSAVTITATSGQQTDNQLPYHPERMLVRFAPGTAKSSRDAVHASLGTSELKSFNSVDGLTVVKVPRGKVEQKVAAFAARGDVLYAEPDFRLTQFGTITNDPCFGL